MTKEAASRFVEMLTGPLKCNVLKIVMISALYKWISSVN